MGRMKGALLASFVACWSWEISLQVGPGALLFYVMVAFGTFTEPGSLPKREESHTSPGLSWTFRPPHPAVLWRFSCDRLEY